jgi:hypothetical protein
MGEAGGVPITLKHHSRVKQERLTPSPPLNSAVPPALLLAGLNAYNLWNEHWEHWSHMPPLEERVEYPYQNIRVRNFPWGDGDKVRLLPHLPISSLLEQKANNGDNRPPCTYINSLQIFIAGISRIPATRPEETVGMGRDDVLTETNSWNDKVNYHNKDKST